MIKTNNIKEAFSKIKIDDKSREKLKEAVLKKLKEKKNTYKRIKSLSRIAASFLVVAGVSALVAIYNFMPVNDVSIDINSMGLQLSLSGSGRVVNCYYDGHSSDFDVKGMNLSKAVSKIVDVSAAEDSSSGVAVVAVCAVKDGDTEALKLKVENEIIQNAESQNISVSVYCLSINSDMIDSAKSEGVTAGKYYLTKLVNAVDFESETSSLMKLRADRLIDMFMASYLEYISYVQIDEGQIPLSPAPGDVQNPTEAVVRPPQSSPDELSEKEIAEQYAKLAGLIK